MKVELGIWNVRWSCLQIYPSWKSIQEWFKPLQWAVFLKGMSIQVTLSLRWVINSLQTPHVGSAHGQNRSSSWEDGQKVRNIGITKKLKLMKWNELSGSSGFLPSAEEELQFHLSYTTLQLQRHHRAQKLAWCWNLAVSTFKWHMHVLQTNCDLFQ